MRRGLRVDVGVGGGDLVLCAQLGLFQHASAFLAIANIRVARHVCTVANAFRTDRGCIEVGFQRRQLR